MVDPSPAAARRPGPRLLATGVAVVAIIFGALAALGTRQLSRDDATGQVRAEALAAARQIAVDSASYDYRHIDSDFTRVANELVGSYKQDYVTQSQGARSLIVSAKAVATAEVAGAGVVSVKGHTAEVVVALNRTVVNTSSPKGQTQAFGLQIDLVDHGGKWLAQQVKPL